MKATIIKLLSLLLLIPPLTSKAESTVNLKTGLSRSNYHNNEYSGKQLDGYNIGVTSDIVIFKSWLIEPGVYYTYKKQYIPGTTYNHSCELNFLEFPVFLKYRKEYRNKILIDWKLGYFFEYGLSGEIGINNYNYVTNEMDNTRYKAWSESTLLWNYFYDERINHGPSLGVGITYNRFILDISYLRGIVDVGTNQFELGSSNAGEDTVRLLKVNIGFRLNK